MTSRYAGTFGRQFWSLCFDICDTCDIEPRIIIHFDQISFDVVG